MSWLGLPERGELVLLRRDIEGGSMYSSTATTRVKGDRDMLPSLVEGRTPSLMSCAIKSPKGTWTRLRT